MDSLHNITSTFCNTRLWDPSVSWDTASPDFTPCFRKTILAWFPGTFLLLMLPLHIIQRRNSLFPEISPSSLYNKKMASIIALLMTQIAVLLRAMNMCTIGEDCIMVNVLSPLVAACYTMLSLHMMYMERRHGILSSGIQFFYWLFSFVCQLGIFQSELRKTLQNSEYSSFNFLQHLTTFVITAQLFSTTFVRETPDFLQIPNKNGEMPSPMLNAPFLSYISTFWMTKFFLKCFRNKIKRSDLFELPKHLKCENLAPVFEFQWIKEKERVSRFNNLKINQNTGKKEDTELRPNVFRALFLALWDSLCLLPVARFMTDCTIFINPFLTKLMLYFAEKPDDYRWKCFAFITILFIVKVSEAFLHRVNRHYYHKCNTMIESTLQSAAYQKTLRLSSNSRKSTTVGDMSTLLSSDIPKIPRLLHACQDAWLIPFQVITGFYFLNYEVGSAVWCTVIVVSCIPVNIYMLKLGKNYHETYKFHSNKRAKVICEVINGIKIIKLYAWEKSFMKYIEGIRNDETYQLAKIRIKDALGKLLLDIIPQMIGILVFGTYVWYGHHITTSTVFVCLSLINVISYPMTALPQTIHSAVEAKISAKKIQDFMELDELNTNAIKNQPPKGISVMLKDCEFSWSTYSKEKTLKNLNFKVKSGSLVAIVGSVGSGKSSLCSALLGEMEKIEGEVHVKGPIAYVPQQPWIQKQTIQNNILFGKTKYCKQYNNVIYSCALKEDLEVFAGGDMAEIGEKGVNLSGGQKQRISLARAVYQNADTYLLDDPLGALDPHVSKHIFQNVLGPKGMLKQKTRILVTHALNVLPEVDNIIVLAKGEITEMGSYEDLIRHNGAFSELVLNFSLEQQAEKLKVDPSLSNRLDDSNSDSDITMYTNSGSYSEKNDNQDAKDVPKDSCESKNTRNVKFMTDDIVNSKVQSHVYTIFFKSIGIKTAMAFMFFKFATICTEAFTSKWQKEWSQDIPTYNSTQDTAQNMYRFVVFTALSSIWGVGCLMYLVSLAFCARNGSIILHKKILNAVFRYPMSFFDKTPMGCLTTVFSSDMDIIDHALPSCLEWCFHHGFIAFVSMVVVATEIPLVMVTFVPVLVLCFVLQHLYGTTSRQLKRLESDSRAPIYSHYIESIQGLSTLRAYKQEDRFYKIHKEKRDELQKCTMAVITSNMWIGTNLNLLGCLVVFFDLLCAFYQKELLTGASLGIIFNYAMRMTCDTNGLLQNLSELDKNMVSAEKVIHLSELETEAAEIVAGNRPEKHWPSEGKIEFINYGTRYPKGQDLVIKNINFTVQPGQKVGIVGRTGAGKSSLTLALYRIIKKAEGCIKIDGLDISDIGLHDLRSRLTIIPQDPVMFSGTIRFNLDPSAEYTDEQLWEAVKHAHLKTLIESLPNKLEHECDEDGKNLSLGERQLICLARALLRKTKILILDEATAAVDLETDNLIQSTIRNKFSNCTILTIAHRINTIMDCDKILVLDHGELVEFDSPNVLLTNGKGYFAQMARDAGFILRDSDS